MGTIIFIVLMVNVILSHFIGKSGPVRNIGYWGAFWLSFLFSPIIGLLFVMASLPLPNEVFTAKNDYSNVDFDRIIALDNKINCDLNVDDDYSHIFVAVVIVGLIICGVILCKP